MNAQRIFFHIRRASLLGAAIFCCASALTQENKSAQLPSKQERSSKPMEPESVRLELTIPSDAHSNKTVVFKVPQNASVSLQVKSERAGELHIHAYRLSLTLKDQDTQSLKFEAKASGKFNIEWHPKPSTNKDAKQEAHEHAHAHSHAAPLASLEVQPL